MNKLILPVLATALSAASEEKTVVGVLHPDETETPQTIPLIEFLQNLRPKREIYQKIGELEKKKAKLTGRPNKTARWKNNKQIKALKKQLADVPRTKWESVEGFFHADYMNYIGDEVVANVDECKQVCDARPECELVYYHYPDHQGDFTCNLGQRTTREEFPFPIAENTPNTYTTYYKIPSYVGDYTCIAGYANVPDVYTDGEEAQRQMQEPECKSGAAGYEGYLYIPDNTGTVGACRYVKDRARILDVSEDSSVWAMHSTSRTCIRA